MKKMLIALALTLASSQVIANEVAISTGGRGGAYHATGEQLAKILTEYDYKTNVMKSKGSIENIDRVADGEADLGFAQLDAVAWWMARNPGKSKNFKVLGNLFPECVYIAVNKDGPIDDESDLQTDKGKIAVQKKGSGAAVTWEYMRELNSKYANSQTLYQGGMQVLSQLASQPDGDVNAFLWVSNPEKLDQRYLNTVLNNDNLKLIDVDDWDLNDKHEELGRSIYRFEKPEVKKGFLNDQEIKTICMDSVVIASKTADDDMVDDVADVLINNRTRLFPPK
jgi:TRAP transporter TAXI family solute receptor